eukprot:365559-Chlamydomonas_euryale.AAC.8
MPRCRSKQLMLLLPLHTAAAAAAAVCRRPVLFPGPCCMTCGNVATTALPPRACSRRKALGIALATSVGETIGWILAPRPPSAGRLAWGARFSTYASTRSLKNASNAGQPAATLAAVVCVRPKGVEWAEKWACRPSSAARTCPESPPPACATNEREAWREGFGGHPACMAECVVAHNPRRAAQRPLRSPEVLCRHPGPRGCAAAWTARHGTRGRSGAPRPWENSSRVGRAAPAAP